MPFHDLRHEQPRRIEADVAIIGGGAAGIAIAMELAHGPHRVALIESGDFAHRHRTQWLYRGRNVGRANISTTFSRFRRFGGSTVRWGGQCRPLDPIDFEAGWPFGHSHLEPYYRRAQRACHLGPYEYDPARWHDAAGGPLPLASEFLQTRVYQFAHPRDFGAAYRDELERAPNVDVWLNANAVRIDMADCADRVTSIAGATLARRPFRIEARHYVLACGGIENARLLLASDGSRSGGIGNERDLVGRYFMDHPYAFPGYFEPARAGHDRSYYVIEGYENTGAEQKMHAAFTLPERLRRDEGLNGCSVYLVRRPRYKTVPAYSSPAGRGLMHLIEVLQHRELPDGRLGRSLRQIARDPGNAMRTIADRCRGAARKDPVLALRACVEATPCRESRVTLGSGFDRFGMRRPHVDWRLNDADKRGYERLLAVMQSEFQRLGLGRVVVHGQCDPDGWPVTLIGGKHHMGTTRMSANAADGVVDADARVHGTANLHVAGSSVFPTGGYANPTLTIVALAIRLADRLKQHLA